MALPAAPDIFGIIRIWMLFGSWCPGSQGSQGHPGHRTPGPPGPEDPKAPVHPGPQGCQGFRATGPLSLTAPPGAPQDPRAAGPLGFTPGTSTNNDTVLVVFAQFDQNQPYRLGITSGTSFRFSLVQCGPQRIKSQNWHFEKRLFKLTLGYFILRPHLGGINSQ